MAGLNLDPKSFVKNLKSKILGDKTVKQVTANQSSLMAPKSDPNLIQIPGSRFPHANFENALWFKMTARELVNLNTEGRGGNITIGKKGSTFKFLAPNQIVDTQQHTWEEYSSIHSRLLQFVISGQIAIDQTKKMFSNLTRPFIHTDPKTGRSSVQMPGGDEILEAIKKTPNVNVPKYKHDTPLRYTNSNRRSYQFTFMLADAHPEDPGSEVQQAVEMLQKYAAPTNVGQLGIEFPYIFQVKTEPGSLINLTYAALENVMATWMEPYINGRAQRCELTLGFKDMSPLFRSTIEKGGIINVNPTTSQPEVSVFTAVKEQTQDYFKQREQQAASRRPTSTPSDNE